MDLASHTCVSCSARPWAACTLGDRKSTRLNSSHLVISYAVFCLKKKNTSHQGDAQPVPLPVGGTAVVQLPRLPSWELRRVRIGGTKLHVEGDTSFAVQQLLKLR